MFELDETDDEEEFNKAIETILIEIRQLGLVDDVVFPLEVIITG